MRYKNEQVVKSRTLLLTYSLCTESDFLHWNSSVLPHCSSYWGSCIWKVYRNVRKNELTNELVICSVQTATRWKHSLGSLYVWELSSDFFHKDGQIVDLVLVDAHCGDTGHVGELDVRRVVVAVQDQSAEPLQLTQQSRVPIKTEWRRTHWNTTAEVCQLQELWWLCSSPQFYWAFSLL